MPVEPEPTNSLRPTVRKRSVTAGDVPEALGRRYFTDGRGGAGLGFYVDARVPAPAFRDRGRQLVTARPDPNAIRDMVAIARHRDWTIVKARGSEDFRREAWLAGTIGGLQVRGYNPTPRDRQELERRQAAHPRPTLARAPEEEARFAAPAQVNLRIVEAVVRARVVEKSAQERILGAARERLARWLDQGARVRRVDMARAAEPDVGRARERIR